MIFGGPETQHGELFSHRRTFFCLAEKKSEFTTEISFREFGFFSAKKKCPTVLKKFAMLSFRSIKNHPNRPA